MPLPPPLQAHSPGSLQRGPNLRLSSWLTPVNHSLLPFEIRRPVWVRISLNIFNAILVDTIECRLVEKLDFLFDLIFLLNLLIFTCFSFFKLFWKNVFSLFSPTQKQIRQRQSKICMQLTTRNHSWLTLIEKHLHAECLFSWKSSLFVVPIRLTLASSVLVCLPDVVYTSTWEFSYLKLPRPKGAFVDNLFRFFQFLNSFLPCRHWRQLGKRRRKGKVGRVGKTAAGSFARCGGSSQRKTSQNGRRARKDAPGIPW